MSSLNEPVGFYRDSLREQHADNVSTYFEELVAASGVDAEANKKLIQEIAELESAHSKNKGQKNWWIVLRVLIWVSAFALVIAAFSIGGWGLAWLLVAGALVFLAFTQVEPKIKALSDTNAALQKEIEEKTDESWTQMESLNELFRWGMSRELMQKVFPDLQLDEHFSEKALHDLVTTYGLSSGFNEGRSILRIQSGRLLSNPIALTRYLQHWIGSRTYSGSMVIYWTENVRNAQGQMQTVQRSQTLTATVVKPFPDFLESAAVILGHEAAPQLSFSRHPSALSGLDETRFNSWRKAGAVKKVEKQAMKQLKSGSGQLTVMSNREFEALFRAVDRDNEIEFRLLYTPLAQQETVKLMNDTSVGYGDDFSFIKQGRVNFVESAHLSEIDFDPDPVDFQSNDLEQAREYFNSFNNEYLRSLFFGFAPLLSIPLYTESRRLPSARDIDGGYLPNAWEVEVMANYIGEETFKHPQSITRNLLLAHSSREKFGGVLADITAIGYQGIDRVDFVPTLGGDGRWHQVPVPWVEYIQVEQNSKLFVARVKDTLDPSEKGGIESGQWDKKTASLGATGSSVIRGNLGAAVVG